MKKIFSTFVIVFLTGLICNAQFCLPYGITFTSQSQIDNFQINYPGCTEIEGEVKIKNDPGENITNLNGLSIVTSMGGLHIGDSYPDLLIPDLTGLNNLTTIGQSLYIENCPLLKDLSGLNSLISVQYVLLFMNDSLQDLSGLGLISYLPNGINLSGSYQLTSLSGLNNLDSAGEVSIGATAIVNLDGLQSLRSVGEMRIGGNEYLSDLTQINGLEHIWGDLIISDNPALQNLNGLESLHTIGGCLNIYYNDSLINLDGLNNIITIKDSLIINGNLLLQSFEGLNSLDSIGGWCDIKNNASISNFEGFEHLKFIGNHLKIIGNESLVSMTGLDSLETIGNYLWIGFHPMLSNLGTFSTLTSIDGILLIQYNSILQSLTGIDNIDANTITNLRIFNNPSLSICEVKSVCDYIALPNSNVEIHDNSMGCNSEPQVEAACIEISTEGIDLNSLTTIISPNPARQYFTISNKKGGIINSVEIYNPIGQIVYQSRNLEMPIDISRLNPGLYLVFITINENLYREKLIVN